MLSAHRRINSISMNHRFDDALYLNHALVQERLKISEKVFELYREEASLYAGAGSD